MSTRMRSLLTVAALLVTASRAAAQTPLVPTALKTNDDKDKVTITYPRESSGTIRDAGEHPVAALTRVYNTGNGQQLNRLAIEILSTLSCSEKFFRLATGKACGPNGNRTQFDFRRDFVLVTWVGLDFSGKRVIYRIGIHDERHPDPYNVTLPGLGRSLTLQAGKQLPPDKPALYEVFLSATADADHTSLYVFTAQPDPLQAQIPAFVQAASGPLFASISKLVGTVNKANLSTNAMIALAGDIPQKPTDPIEATVKVSKLTPPLKVAKVKVSDVAVQPFPYVDFQRQARDLADKLLFVDARQSKCATAYISRLTPQLTATSQSSDCTGPTSTPAICRTAFTTVFEREYAAAGADCAKELTGVDAEFRKLVAAQQPERLTADNALTNTPLTHWSFGILTAYAFGETVSGTRVKVGGDGKLAPDPLSRQLTAFVVNIAPSGYPADAPKMSWAERVRAFAGVTATPEFGFTAGISVQIWKAVGVNFGGAWMAIPTFADPNDRIGQTPTDPNAPFGTAHASAAFVGAHYNFSGK